jgi:type IV pilus assembly protein PilE
MRRDARTPECGFSLLECLIAVAVLGMLSALAVPLQSTVWKSLQRAQGRSALAQASWWMERQASLLGNYPSVLPDSAWMQDGLQYGISLNGVYGGYVLTAQPQGPQSTDGCGSLWLNHLGQRGASGNATSCW